MKKKYKPIIPEELMKSIVNAKNEVRNCLKNKKITYSLVTKLIRSCQGELGSMRRRNFSDEEIINAELCVGFLKDIHKENLAKYESYKDQSYYDKKILKGITTANRDIFGRPVAQLNPYINPRLNW